MRRGVDKTVAWWARVNIFSDYMCYHMPAYYLMAGKVAQGVGIEEPAVFPASNPLFGNGHPAMFLHTPEKTHAQPAVFVGLRSVSILFGLATLAVAYALAYRFFPQERVIPLLAMTLVATWPQFLFINRTISNDTMATAVAVLTLLVLTEVGKPRRFILVALLSVLAFLTKLSVAFSAGAVLVVWGLETTLLAKNKRPYFHAVGGMVTIWFLAGVLVYLSPPLWTNWQLSTQEFAGLHWGANSAAYWQQVYSWTVRPGWAWFGWLTVSPPGWHAQLWWLFIEIATVVGAYLSFKQGKSNNARFLVIVLAVWWAATVGSYVRVTANRWQPQFRFASTTSIGFICGCNRYLALLTQTSLPMDRPNNSPG